MAEPGRYILVTAMKDEMRSLPEFIRSILAQTILPTWWLIVDDGSHDGSYEYAAEQSQVIPWLQVRKTGGMRKREIGFHYAYVTKYGLDQICGFCLTKRIEYDYVALLDADILLEPAYFENLMKKFVINRRLGVASGVVVSRTRKKLIREKEPVEWPCGAARMWSRRCYERTGWRITRAPDSVSTVLAMNAGFETCHFEDLTVLQTRATYSAGGFWTGFIDLGRTRYYLGYSPFYAILASFKHLFSYPHTGSIPFLVGYFGDFFASRKRIPDPVITRFFNRRLVAKFRSRLLDHQSGRL